jgi:nucleoside-diphosphate-sugar epimerase
MMKAFVTGATGFLGGRLVPRLLAEGAEVCCLVRSPAGAAALRAAVGPEYRQRLEVCHGTLARVADWSDALAGCDTVFHLAAEVRGAAAVLFAGNVIATRKLIEAARDVRRFVLVSSLAVYGTDHLRAWDVLDEECPLDPNPHRRDAYTYSKIAQEQVAWGAHRTQGLPLVVVRPGVIYGPGRDCLGGRLGLRFGNFLVKMGGRHPLPYTFVDNCAAAVARAGLAPDVEGQAFNVVDDDPITGGELLRRYRAAVGGLRWLTVPGWAIGPLSGLCEWYHRRSNGQLPAVLTRYRSRAMWRPLRTSNARARLRLGWSPAVPFVEGLEQTLASVSRKGSAALAA